MLVSRCALAAIAAAFLGLGIVELAAGGEIAPVVIGEALAKDMAERPVAYEEAAAEESVTTRVTFESEIETVSELLGEDCQGDSCCDCCCPWWTVELGAVILTRRARSALLIEDSVTGDPVLNASAFGSSMAGGADLTVRRWINDCRAAELRFFMADEWNEQTSFTTPAIFNFPTIPPVFGLGAADVAATYRARLYSTELNVRQTTSEWLTWIAGLRYMELNEDLEFVADFGGNVANVAFRTGNRLYGGQVGARVNVVDRCAWQVETVGKAGVFGNAANQTFSEIQQVGPNFGARQSKGEFSFVGELQFLAAYYWTEAVTLRAGYELLWLEGVAIAPDQASAVDFFSSGGINTDGGAFYHGALLSAEVIW